MADNVINKPWPNPAAPMMGAAAPPDKEKQQPTKKLPTDRIAFNKQVDILRAYGLMSQGGTKPVNPRAVAEMMKMSATTVPLMNTFLVENGFVEKSGNDFLPHKALIEFAQAHSWNPETAPRKLAPLIGNTWFGERMRSRLLFSPMSQEEMIADLAAQIAAAPEFKPQIESLIDLAVLAGVVKRDGTQLTAGDTAQKGPESTMPPRTEKPADTPEPSPAPTPRSGTVASGFMSSEGGVQFHVAIKVDMKEMGSWSADRIGAFFAGLAQVLAAKKGTEEI